jgi:hypothetical protein
MAISAFVDDVRHYRAQFAAVNRRYGLGSSNIWCCAAFSLTCPPCGFSRILSVCERTLGEIFRAWGLLSGAVRNIYPGKAIGT